MVSASGAGTSGPLELGGEDVRKKREYSNDQDGSLAEEDDATAPFNGNGDENNDDDEEEVDDDDNDDKNERNKTIGRPHPAATIALATVQPSESDLETVLHQVMWNDAADKEFLSADSWITFRVGHAGDASTIASLFRSTVSLGSSSDGGGGGGKLVATKDDGKSCKLNDDIDDAFELQLAAGLGDEDTPPAVFCVFADVTSNKHADIHSITNDEVSGNTTVSQIGAVALFSLGWEFGTRVLRIEWFHVDETIAEHDLIKRRLWFRLSALALTTACQLLLPPSSSAAE